MKFIIIIVSIIGAHSLPINDEPAPTKQWRLNIIHTNDMHGRFLPTSGGEAALPCEGQPGGSGPCYGGFARISTLIKRIRERANQRNESTLYLDGGDIFDGSLLFEKYTAEICYTLFNLLQANVTVLGNHEFVKKLDNLTSYITHLSFPALASNLDTSNEKLHDLKNLGKSLVLNVDGHKVGIVGYTYNMTYFPGVKFLSELETVKAEVQKLKQQNVSIIIGLSHSGYIHDQYIASQVDDIDLIISGHSHSLLKSGQEVGSKFSSQIVEGPYPTVVSKVENGRKRNVYIVTAYAYTKYLGNLSVVFDEDGEVKEIEGRPILVDQSIPEDPVIVDALRKFPEDPINETVVGYSRVPLKGNFAACRGGECTLGDVVADAFVEYNLILNPSEINWTDAAIAFVHSGLIADGMHNIRRNPILEFNIQESLSKVTEIYKVDLTGKEILTQLEYMVSRLARNKISEFSFIFDQVSGIKVKFNLSEPVGSRIVPGSVFVRCADCKVPKYEEIVEDKVYRVLANFLLATSKYKTSNWNKTKFIKLDPTRAVTANEAVRWYIKNRSPVHPELGERIVFV